MFFLFQLSFFVLSHQISENVEDVLKFPPGSVTKESILTNQNHKKLLSNESLFADEEFAKLAYVSLWNPKGFALAVKTAKKLTHVSPVWFSVLQETDSDGTSMYITGLSNIRLAMRKANPEIKIVPRFTFSSWDNEQMERFIGDEYNVERISESINYFCNKYRFDGAVIEILTHIIQWPPGNEKRKHLIESVKQIADHLKRQAFISIFPILGLLNQNSLNVEEFTEVSKNVNYIQIMGYDYYQKEELLGIAPYDWVESTLKHYQVESPNILMGLNFYGINYNDMETKHITSELFLEYLKNPETVLEYDSISKEHLLIENGHKVYYPSLTSIELRMRLARKFNCGLSIWDYGQGLDYFTNLL